MRMLLVSFLTIGISASCWADAPNRKSLDRKPEKTRSFHAIQYFAQPGRVVAFGGDALKWTGEGDCSQNESMEPLISVQGDGVTLRDAVVVRSPDGVHVSGKNVVIENLIFPEVCEDAITANGADNLIIRNCAFRGARDKVIQLNGGKNILIENCYFEKSSKLVRVKKGVTVTVRNNVARDVTVFVMADGEGARALVEGNDVKGAKWFARAEKKATIELGPNKLSKIEKSDLEKGGGTVRKR